jgi:uncharacterized glyoxalase superfamily protein PhnB
MHLDVANCDEAVKRAAAAGAQVLKEPWDAFWGDRYGIVADPFGHRWSLATHVREVSQEDMAQAQATAMSEMPKSA